MVSTDPTKTVGLPQNQVSTKSGEVQKAVLTSKGQITIPKAIRERLHLKTGDVLEFDENATILQARRIIEPEE